MVSDYSQMDRILREERQYLLNICKKMKKAGCNVLLVQKLILRYERNEELIVGADTFSFSPAHKQVEVCDRSWYPYNPEIWPHQYVTVFGKTDRLVRKKNFVTFYIERRCRRPIEANLMLCLHVRRAFLSLFPLASSSNDYFHAYAISY